MVEDVKVGSPWVCFCPVLALDVQALVHPVRDEAALFNAHKYQGCQTRSRRYEVENNGRRRESW